VIALGGGVVGDLAGFVAATYMRGVPVVQVPTSLLAMVDAAVGGKTGVDTVHGKNLIGAFHQPARVYIDLAFLATLPRRHLCNGLAEVIKAAAIWEPALFEFLERHAEGVLAGDRALLRRAVLEAVRIKARVVTEDEREGGLREILNFGHSIGHAVEALMQPGMLHGEGGAGPTGRAFAWAEGPVLTAAPWLVDGARIPAVAIGMVKEAELARALGVLDHAHVARLAACLQLYELPTALPDGLTVESLLAKMAVDKKNRQGAKAVNLLAKIGQVHGRRAQPVPDAAIALVRSRGCHGCARSKGWAYSAGPLGIDACARDRRSARPSRWRRPPRAPSTAASVCRAPSRSPTARCFSPASARASAGWPCAGGPPIPGPTHADPFLNRDCPVGPRLTGLLHSDDTRVMLDALQRLSGAAVEWADDGATAIVTGSDGRLRVPDEPLFLGNAGTAARFLTTVCTLAERPADGPAWIRVTGNRRMHERPIGPLVDALRRNGQDGDAARNRRRCH